MHEFVIDCIIERKSIDDLGSSIADGAEGYSNVAVTAFCSTPYSIPMFLVWFQDVISSRSTACEGVVFIEKSI